MRKIIVSMNVTLDGLMAGAGGELDWHFKLWNEEMAHHALQQLNNVDTILLGRVTYTAMAKYWPFAVSATCYPREDIAFADLMNQYQKVVVSASLKTAGWNNTNLVKENFKAEIIRLKKGKGKNIILYGSRSVALSLMRWNLVDEYNLWIHPVVLGKGKPLFGELNNALQLELMNTIIFNTGVVLSKYRVNRVKHA